MEDIIPCPMEDQEVFRRVWQRVMAGRDPAGSPIQPGFPSGEGDLSCQCLADLARQGEEARPGCGHWDQEAQQPPGGEAPGQEGGREQPGQETPDPPEADGAPAQGLPAGEGPHRGSDLPQLWKEPQPSDDRTARLRRQVMEALEGWQFYRHLARRARGADQRVLNNLAGELHKQARKLSAAYFLLTGVRYWPSELLSNPAIPSYWGALRTRHQAEQRQENAFRLASDDWEDPDLLALYSQLIEASQRRCRQLRSLLERDDT